MFVYYALDVLAFAFYSAEQGADLGYVGDVVGFIGCADKPVAMGKSFQKAP